MQKKLGSKAVDIASSKGAALLQYILIMSEGVQAIPKTLNLGLHKPTSVPAYTRRVTSIATNAQTFTETIWQTLYWILLLQDPFWILLNPVFNSIYKLQIPILISAMLIFLLVVLVHLFKNSELFVKEHPLKKS